MKKKAKKSGKGKKKRGLKFTEKPRPKQTKKKINLDFATKPKDRRRKKREEVEYYYYDDFQKKEKGKDEESNKDNSKSLPFNDEDYIFYSMSQEALVKKFIEKEKFYNISKEVKNEVSQERLNSRFHI